MSILYDHNGNFQWAVVTAVISIIGVVTTICSSLYTNKKTIRANVQSKTSIEWLNQIRNLSANLISNYESLISSAKFSYGNHVIAAMHTEAAEKAAISAWETGFYDITPAKEIEGAKQAKRTYDEKYNEYVNVASSLYNQLLLYFVDDEEHSKIVQAIENIHTKHIKFADFTRGIIKDGQEYIYYENLINNSLELTNELSEAVGEFRSEITGYLRNEWENIKLGK